MAELEARRGAGRRRISTPSKLHASSAIAMIFNFMPSGLPCVENHE
jgi:hypothetical protein